MPSNDPFRMTDQADPSSIAAPALQMSTIFPILWRRLWVIVLVLVLSVLAGWIYLRQQVPAYRSTARVYVDRVGPQIIRPGEADMFSRDSSFRITQAELIRSLPVLSKVMDNPEIKNTQTLKTEEGSGMMVLRMGLEVTVGTDQLIYVNFNSPYPQESAKIVNAVVDGYVEFINEQKRNTATEVLRILQREKQNQDVELSARLKRMTDFRINSGQLALATGSGNVISDQLSASSLALSKLQLNMIEGKALWEATKVLADNPSLMRSFVESQRSKGVFVTVDNEEQRKRNELEQLRMAMVEVQRDLNPEHPRVQNLAHRISELERQLSNTDTEFSTNQLAVAEQNYLAIERQYNDLSKFLESLRGEARQLNTQMAEYELLRSEYEQTKQLVDIINSRIKELNITETAGAMNVMVLEVATPSTEPFSPNPSKIMKFAVALGLITGLCLALGIEFVDDRLRSVEQVTATLPLNVLGVVPDARAETPKTGTLVQSMPHSPAAESYRTIRTGLFFGAAEGKARTILITSPNPGEGKTTLATNLAMTLAQSGQRTILLDADFRRPRVHLVFGLNNDRGLSEVISRNEPVEQVFQAGPVENLTIVPCGALPPNPAELLNSDAFRRTLQHLAKQFDHVVLDSAPVLAVSDGRILAAQADQTILVIRAERTRKRHVRQAYKALMAVGAHVLGTVVNAAPRRGDRYGYYGSHYGGYYGGNPKDAAKPESTASKSKTAGSV